MCATPRKRQSPALWICIIFTATAVTALILGGGVLYLAKKLADANLFGVNQVARLIENEDWEELERLAAEYRTQSTRDEYGGWLILGFYQNPAELRLSHDRTEMENLIGHIEAWIRSKPDSVTAPLMLAKAHEALAWRVRGGGTADTVTAQDREVFQQHIDIAWGVAQPLTRLPNPEVTVYATLLDLGTARGESRESMESLLAAGRAINRDFDPLYSSYAWYLMPRWYGEHGDPHKFALRVLEEEGEEMYALLTEFFWRNEGRIVQHMTRPEPAISGLETLVEKHPENDNFKNALLRCYCIFARLEDAKAFTEKYAGTSHAVSWQDDEWGEWIFEDGPYPGHAPIPLAVINDNPERIRQLVLEGEDIDLLSLGNTALTQAVEGFRDETVRTLLELGADPEVTDDEGRTPLLIAADYGQLDAVRYLRDAGANINATAEEGWTALHYAANDGRAELIELLLAAPDIQPNRFAGEYTTPLLLTLDKDKEAACLALLADPRVKAAFTTPNSSSTPLHYAVKADNAPILRAFLAREDVNPNARDGAACTPLMRAVHEEAANSVRILAQDPRTDINARQDNRNTPLIEAAKRGNTRIVSLLLRAEDIDTNAGGGEFSRSALHQAAAEGHTDTVKTLLADPRVNPNPRTTVGKTPLDLARQYGHLDIVEILENATR